MKIVSSKENLSSALTLAESIIPTRLTMSILSNILIETITNNTVKISSTDLDIRICVTINSDVINKGSVALAGKYITNIVKSFPNDDIEITVDENNTALIKSKNEEAKAEFKIKGSIVADYPVFPDFEKEIEFMVSQKLLREMIKKTIYAVSMEDERTAINGVKMEVKGKKIRFVATDSRRLALMEAEIDSKIEKDIDNVIIPHKALNELFKVLKEEGNVLISLSKNLNLIYFKIDNIEIFARLTDSRFPDYTRVIPQHYEKVVVFFTNKMLNAVKRVSILSSEKQKRIKFRFRKDKLILSSYEEEIGEAYEEVEIVYNYPDFEIDFSSEYLNDVFNAINTEKFIMGFNTPQSAAVVKEEGNDNFLCLIMPLKI